MPADARVMLVAGAAGQIGSHLAAHFAACGWRVAGLDRVRPADPAGTFIECDLSDGASAAEAFEAAARDAGTPHAVVNCAGLIANAPLVTLADGAWTVHDTALWHRIVDASLTTAFHVSGHAARHMLAARKPGVIVHISSICARGSAGQVAYSAAKAGVEGLTRTLGKELGAFGIRVVAVALGYFDTASMHENVPAARLTKVVSGVPLKRLGALPDAASAVQFAIDNAYANGTVIDVNGGLVL